MKNKSRRIAIAIGIVLALGIVQGSFAKAPACDLGDINAEGVIEKALDYPYVLLGEGHGTREVPKFVGAFVCVMAQNNKRILLALEMPADFTKDITDYWATSSLDREKTFFESLYWGRVRPDGRTSLAMFELIQYVGELRAQGLKIDIIGVEQEWYPRKPRSNKNKYMGEQLTKAYGTRKYDQVIFLSGSAHTRIEYVDTGYRKLKTVTAYLNPHVFLSVKLSAKEGTSWSCQGPRDNIVCGGHKRTSDQSQKHTNIYIEREGKNNGFHGEIMFKKVTASEPAYLKYKK